MTQKVHHQTERGARIALAKRLISRASYEAVLCGELSLAEAKELGREGAPERPARVAAVRRRPGRGHRAPAQRTAQTGRRSRCRGYRKTTGRGRACALAKPARKGTLRPWS